MSIEEVTKNGLFRKIFVFWAFWKGDVSQGLVVARNLKPVQAQCLGPVERACLGRSCASTLDHHIEISYKFFNRQLTVKK